jgi:hypothetical protein
MLPFAFGFGGACRDGEPRLQSLTRGVELLIHPEFIDILLASILADWLPSFY